MRRCEIRAFYVLIKVTVVKVTGVLNVILIESSTACKNNGSTSEVFRHELNEHWSGWGHFKCQVPRA